MALAIVLMAIALLSLVLSAALQVGASDARATRAYRRTSQVHLAAESGILHAVQVAQRSAGVGVLNFQTQVVNSWATNWAPSTKPFSPLPGFSYSVVAISNAADPVNSGWFRATAVGPEGATNTVVASVSRFVFPANAPGALYLANPSPTDATFNGNSFSISGNDMNYTGGAGPGAPVPGISTLTNTNTQEAINSLSSNQDHDVTGLGYSSNPLIPSVMTTSGGPNPAQIDSMVADLLTLPGVITQGSGTINNSSSISGWQIKNNDPAPTPKITHFTGDVTFKGNGNITGQGILIVDGNLTLNGKITFDGLIIVRGKTNVTSDTDVTGNAVIYGSLWTTDLNMVVGGSAIVQYSTQALALANQLNNGQNHVAKIVINSMIDCADVPAGTNNC
jgi:hypothetical protein